MSFTWDRRERGGGTWPLLVAAILVTSTCPAQGSTFLGILPHRGVYIQEYWSNGTPWYWIANQRDEPALLTAEVFPDTASASMSSYEWSLAPGEIAIDEAPQPLGGHRLRLSLDGEFFGNVRTANNRFGSSEHDIATFVNLDSPNIGDTDVWCEQDSLWFAAGHDCELVLAIRRGAGVLLLNTPSMEHILPEVLVERGTCATLTVTKLGHLVAIDASRADAPNEVHRVRLGFKAPPAQKESVYSLSGSLVRPNRPNGHVWRGVLVRP